MLAKSLMMVAVLALAAMPAGAQVRTVDPNQAIDADLGARATRPVPRTTPVPVEPARTLPADAATAPLPEGATRAAQEARAEETTRASETYERDDLLAAGEGVFGKGAAGLAGILERILKDQGRPNAYIAGREASGAFVVGLRYGSGVMTHKVEGQQPVY